MLSTIFVLIVVSLNPLHASYNGECWVVSGGDTVYKLNADGLADPTIIPGLTQAQAAVVDPQSGVVWIAVSAANAVFRYDPAELDPNQAFITLPPIERPHAVSVNPTDGTVWIGGINTVQKFSADGTQILVSITGVHEPEVAVNTTDGSCWVTDSRGTIARYSAAGAAAATSPVKLSEPKYVAVNSQSGNAWVTDPHANVIVKLSPSGQELLRITDIELPSSPSINQKDGSLWVVARPTGGSNALVKLSADGQKLIEVPEAGIAILSISVSSQDGSVWVADQQIGMPPLEGTVTKFSAAGQALVTNPIPQPSFVSVGNWVGQ
jgi:streptogramin lyase